MVYPSYYALFFFTKTATNAPPAEFSRFLPHPAPVIPGSLALVTVVPPPSPHIIGPEETHRRTEIAKSSFFPLEGYPRNSRRS